MNKLSKISLVALAAIGIGLSASASADRGHGYGRQYDRQWDRHYQVQHYHYVAPRYVVRERIVVAPPVYVAGPPVYVAPPAYYYAPQPRYPGVVVSVNIPPLVFPIR